MSSIWNEAINYMSVGKTKEAKEANVQSASAAPPVPARSAPVVPAPNAPVVPARRASVVADEGFLDTVKNYLPPLPSFFGGSAVPIESPHTEKTPLLRPKNNRV